MASGLEKELNRWKRHARSFAVLMLDVDRFKDRLKHFNDEHGHLAGDDVLTAFGRVIRDATRDQRG